MHIKGNHWVATHTIEARYKGGAWTALTDYVDNGLTFTGTLPGVTDGQGTLEIRCTDHVGEYDYTSYVGVGDVYIIAGQSNAVGYAYNNQTYSHATLKAGLFGNDYVSKELFDPTDSATNQVDAVSNDGVNALGSIWPLVATSFMADQSVPVMFVPCALGGSVILSWQPGADHEDRATLYGSMVYRARQQLNGVKAVLWWQGETDAAIGTTQVNYSNWLVSLANAINADLGVQLVACKLQDIDGYATQPNQDAINAAIGANWGVGNVLQGPDLTDMLSDDVAHLRTDAKLAEAASRWWTRLQALFY